MVWWFQRQPSLDLCLGSVDSYIVSAVCIDWHHPRNCLSGCNPTSQDLWGISCWNVIQHPELTKASPCLRALLISYMINAPGKHWAYSWEQGFPQFFWGTGAVSLALAKFYLLESFAELLESAQEDSKSKSPCLTVSSLKQGLLCQSLVKYFHSTAPV